MKNLLFALFLLFGANATAQTYNFFQSANSYIPINGSVAMAAGWDDYTSSIIPIGFTFTFEGIQYADCYVGANGYINFGSPDYVNVLAIASHQYPIVAGLSLDITDGSGPNSNPITYTTTGVAPNRVFTAQWKNCTTYTNADTINFQIKLKEFSNTVEIIYGDCNLVSNHTAQVGIAGAPNNWSSRTAACDWAVTASASNTATIPLSMTCHPATGLTFDWATGYTASSDSFGLIIDKYCNNPHFAVFTNHYPPAMAVKTDFGDGQSSTTPISANGNGGDAYFDHLYQQSGSYTIREYLYIGNNIIDSLHSTYEHVLCSSIPVKFYYDLMETV